ncbi:gamma-glutamylcyclotransferase family protein [Geobacillus subterraneus]|uniref:gamma-glutamylcyclotransferase family protein n=1 Tax=Geobacillus subterraneus TaxID=129338 RepID=UPI0017CF9B18
MYFVYGSCMSERDFRRTAPHFEVIGRVVLDDYRLAFTRYLSGRQGGVADIVPSPGDRVEGVLYKISSHYVKDLDWR